LISLTFLVFYIGCHNHGKPRSPSSGQGFCYPRAWSTSGWWPPILEQKCFDLVFLLINKEIIMLTAGVMWLFGVPLVVVVLIYFFILRRR